MIKKEDFTIIFESHGTTFFFEDMVIDSYYTLTPEVLHIYQNGGVQTRLSNSSIRLMNEQGMRWTLKDVEEAVATLQNAVNDARTINEHYRTQKDFTKEDTVKMVESLKLGCQGYGVFDFNYWDDTFAASETNEEAKQKTQKVQSFKNKIREELDDIYFGDDGLQMTLLKGLSLKFNVPVKDLEWYSVDEIYNLFEGKTADQNSLDSRRQYYVVHKQQGEKSKVYYAKEAQEIISIFTEEQKTVKEIKGRTANSTGKKVTAQVTVIARDYADYEKTNKEMEAMPEGNILVSETTEPAMMPAMRKASAIISDVGGMLSHTAITSRELGVPCIVGTQNASKILKTGDLVEVDAERGIITILK